jgi:hypothetical protein
MWHNYELDSAMLKTDQPLTLWKTDRGIVEIAKDTFAIAVTQDGKPQGYIFNGNGKLTLDTIVETEQGAVGKPTEKTLTEPFLMLGNPQNIESHLTAATNEDSKDFTTKAEDFFHHFFKNERTFTTDCCGHHHEGLIFAFSNPNSRPDLLVLNDSKIVYKTKQVTFVSDEDKDVLKSPEHMVVSNRGKCVIIKARN